MGHARYVGRVGVLAVVLGVGGALAGQPVAVALPDGGAAGTASADTGGQGDAPGARSGGAAAGAGPGSVGGGADVATDPGAPVPGGAGRGADAGAGADPGDAAGLSRRAGMGVVSTRSIVIDRIDGLRERLDQITIGQTRDTGEIGDAGSTAQTGDSEASGDIGGTGDSEGFGATVTRLITGGGAGGAGVGAVGDQPATEASPPAGDIAADSGWADWADLAHRALAPLTERVSTAPPERGPARPATAAGTQESAGPQVPEPAPAAIHTTTDEAVPVALHNAAAPARHREGVLAAAQPAKSATEPVPTSAGFALAPLAGTTADPIRTGAGALHSAAESLTGVVAQALAVVGLAPLSGGLPGAPAAPSPALWAALAWVRRELHRTFFNDTPTVAYNPDDNSQSVDGVISGDLNASDADGDTLTYTIGAAPTAGSVAVDEDGGFTYTPGAELAAAGGTDTFTVTVSDDTGDRFGPIGINQGTGFFGIKIHGLAALTDPDGGFSSTAEVTVTVAPVNPVPVEATADTAETDQNTPVDIDVLGNDTGTGALAIEDIDTAATEGAATLNPDGTITYTPGQDAAALPEDQHATDTFSYTVIDALGATDTATVTVTVAGLNDTPTARDDTADATDGDPITITVLANDTDPDTGDTLAIEDIDTTATEGSATLDPDGTITYTPAANPQNDTDTLTYTITDQHGATDTATVTIALDNTDEPISVGNTPVAVAVAGDRAYVANFADGTVSVVDTLTNTVIGEPITVGDRPQSVVAVGDQLYVVNRGDGTVSVIDTTTDTVVDTITVGNTPWDAVADGDRLYVSNNEDDTVSVIDTTTNTLIDTDPTTPEIDPIAGVNGASHLVVAGDRLYVASHTDESVFDDVLTVIDTTTYGIVDTDPTTPGVAEPINIPNTINDLAVAGDQVYVTGFFSGAVYVVDTNTNTLVDTLSIARQPARMTVDGDRLFITHLERTIVTGLDFVTVVDTSTNTPLGTIDVGSFGGAMAVTGDQLYVTDPDDGTVSVIDLTAPVANMDRVETLVGTPVDVDVLANDLSVDGAELTVTGLDTDSTTGTVEINPDGTIAYTPEAGFQGSDTFGYTMTNGTGTAASTVTVHVNSFVDVGDGPQNLAVAGDRVYIANGSDDTVAVFDMTTNTVVDTIAVGDLPQGLAVVGDRLYVANLRDDTVTVIDTTTNTVVDTDPTTPDVDDPISVGSGPRGVAIAGDRVYVTNSFEDTVVVIDTATNAITETITVGNRPVAAEVVGDRLYVTNRLDGTVTVIDTTTNTVIDTDPTTPDVDDPITVGANPLGLVAAGDRLYVANQNDDTVTVIDTTTNAVTATISVGDFPQYVAVAGDRLFVTSGIDDTVTIIDTTTNTVLAELPVGDSPRDVAVAGDRLFVANQNDDTISIFDISAPITFNDTAATLVNTPVNIAVLANDVDVAGTELTIAGLDTESTNGDVTLNPDGTITYTPAAEFEGTDAFSYTVTDGTGTSVARVTVDVGSAIGVGESPTDLILVGDRIYVTNIDDNTVSVIDAATNTIVDADPSTPGNQPITVGERPWGLAAAGDILYVGNQFDDTVSVIDTTTNTIVDTITDVGDRPENLVVVGDRLYVANAGDDTVTVIDTTTNTIVDTDPTTPDVDDPITVGESPQGVAAVGDRVYVANRFGGSVSVIDTTTNTVTATIAVDNLPTGLAASGDRLYVTHESRGIVTVINTATNSVIDTIPAGTRPSGMTVSGDRLYVTNLGEVAANDPTGNAVTVIDLSTNTVLSEIPVGEDPLNVVVVGDRLYVTNRADDTVSVIELTEPDDPLTQT